MFSDTEMLLPDSLTVRHSVQYATAPCGVAAVTDGVRANALEAIDRIPCINNRTCEMTELSVGCAGGDGQGSKSPLTVTIALSLSEDKDMDEANATQEGSFTPFDAVHMNYHNCIIVFVR